MHFNNYSPDLGRKGFNRELTDFAKTVARSITEVHLTKLRHLLKANPLGVPPETADALKGRVTDPRILEYKFSLDGLIEDVDSHDKNIKDVDLCIMWETGSLYKERFGITSLLVPENADQRQYHGVTHVLTDLESGAKICDLVVLSELVAVLNDPKSTYVSQREKYE